MSNATLTAEENRSIFGFDSGFRRPRVMRKTHQHQELELNLILDGRFTYLLNGELVRIEAGRLTVFWAAAPHQIISVEGRGKFYWFTLPFAWLPQWGLAPWFMSDLLKGRLFMHEPDSQDAVRCARWHEDIASGIPERLRIAQLEIEARLRRSVLASDRANRAPGVRPMDAGAAGHVQRMLAVMTARYTEKLTIADIARPTGLHPNYAITLFKRICGLGVMDHLVQMRIFHARRMLTTTDAKVIDVAAASGFGSLSRFYEAFARHNGCSPRRYRAHHRA